MSLVLKELSVKNFKCFKKQQNLEFKKITLLTGANSSGKSSVLHAILGLVQSGGFPLKFSTNGKYVNMGDFKEISNRHNSKQIEFICKFYSKSTNLNLTYKTVWKRNVTNNLPELIQFDFISEPYQLQIKKLKDCYSLDFYYDPQLDPEYSPENEKKQKDRMMKNFLMRRELSAGSVTKKEYDKQIAIFKKYINSLYKKTVIKGHKIKELDNLYQEVKPLMNLTLEYVVDVKIDNICREYDSNINAISSFRHHPDRTYLEQTKDRMKVDKFGEGYLDQIILWEKRNIKKFTELNNIMQELGLFNALKASRIKGGRYELLVKPKTKSVATSLFDVGFGVSQFLPIIVADLQLRDESTLFVAEPEIHLHPNVQAKFGDYLVKQLSKNKNYIIETHSEYLLNRLRLAITKGELSESDLAVYYLENNGDEVDVHKIKFGSKGQIEGAPNGFFETYMLDVMDIALSV